MRYPVICGECNMEFEEGDDVRVYAVCAACEEIDDNDDALELAAWRAVARWLDGRDRFLSIHPEFGAYEYPEHPGWADRVAHADSITALADALGLEWRS